jgi:hypothetical protein
MKDSENTSNFELPKGDFAPVILYSQDAEAIYNALLASGYTDLAEKVRAKAGRSRLDIMYAEHVDCGCDGDFDVDDNPVIAQGATGAYVMVWRWVGKDEIRQSLRDNREIRKLA